MSNTDLKTTEGILEVSTEISDDAKWYVVHTYSGHEKKVAYSLKERAELTGQTNKIFTIFIPQQQKIVISEGKKKSVDERLFPGYILVQMSMNDDSWHLVRGTKGVTGFVGAGSKPSAVSEAEVKALMKFTRMEAPKFQAKFTVGDTVKVTEGPFKDNEGHVDEVNEEAGKVKVLLNIFGRETPVEFDFTQVSSI